MASLEPAELSPEPGQADSEPSVSSSVLYDFLVGHGSSDQPDSRASFPRTADAQFQEPGQCRKQGEDGRERLMEASVKRQALDC